MVRCGVSGVVDLEVFSMHAMKHDSCTRSEVRASWCGTGGGPDAVGLEEHAVRLEQVALRVEGPRKEGAEADDVSTCRRREGDGSGEATATGKATAQGRVRLRAEARGGELAEPDAYAHREAMGDDGR